MSDDTLLIVLEVSGDTPRIPEVIEQLRAHLNAGEVTVRGFDRGYLAIRQDAELILDVFREPELGGGRHFVTTRVQSGYDTEWVIEHSLRCRRTNQMADCFWISRLFEENADGDLPEPGRYELVPDEDEDGALSSFSYVPAPLDVTTAH